MKPGLQTAVLILGLSGWGLGNAGGAAHFPWTDIVASGADSMATELSATFGEHGAKSALGVTASAIPFLVPPAFGTNPRPTSIQSGDLNGDGHLDLVVAEHLGPSVTIYHGSGAGTFTVGTRLTFAARPTYVAVHDMNSDGRGDLVLALWNPPTGSGFVAVVFNDESAGWVIGPWTEVGKLPVYVAVADWSGDGLTDAATANWIGNSATVLRNTGNGQFVAVADLLTSPNPASVAFTDLEGDGHSDLLVGGFGCNMAVGYRHSGGDAWAIERGLGVQWAAYFATAHELDGANGSDVMICSANGAASVMLNDGRASFEVWTDYPTLEAPVHACIVDLDSDGQPDIATSHYAVSGVTPLLNRGPDGFVPMLGNSAPGAAPSGIASGNGATAVAAGDFNEDGRIDLATVDVRASTVTLLFGQANGEVAANHMTSTPPEPWAMAGADFNLDAIPDVAVALPGTDRVNVYLGRPDGRLESPGEYSCGGRPQALAAGDLNGDGVSDLITANNQAGSISVFLNRGDGSFDAPVDYAVSQEPADVAIGDFTGDGRPDLAVACLGADNVRTAINLGDGRFEVSPTALVSGDGTASVAFFDFNFDGRADLAAANYYAGSVRIWVSRGGGDFAATALQGALTGAWALETAQIVAGGAPELLCASRGSNFVSVLEVGSAGQVTRVRTVTTGTNPAGIATSDFNGDRVPDAAVVNYNSASMTVLENVSGQLLPWQQIPIGRFPVAVLALDHDLNGTTDLCVASLGDQSLITVRSLRAAPVAAPELPRRSLWLGRPSPNPSSGSVRLSFAVPSPEQVKVVILDVAGREVARLREGMVGPGPVGVAWDGRDAGGGQVRSGVYFFVIRAGAQATAVRFVVTR